jgi:hypothetical protein
MIQAPGVFVTSINLGPKNARDRINNNSFTSQLTNGPNKLECYITLG